MPTPPPTFLYKSPSRPIWELGRQIGSIPIIPVDDEYFTTAQPLPNAKIKSLSLIPVSQGQVLVGKRLAWDEYEYGLLATDREGWLKMVAYEGQTDEVVDQDYVSYAHILHQLETGEYTVIDRIKPNPSALLLRARAVALQLILELELAVAL